MSSQNAGYRKLRVWREAHELVLIIYKLTQHFPKEEMFGLTIQLRRAVISIVANIVEGQARKTKKEFLQFLFVANGSLVEVEYYLELSLDLGYIDSTSYQRASQQRITVGNLLNGLIKSLKT